MSLRNARCNDKETYKLLFGLQLGKGLEFLELALEQMKDCLSLIHGCT